LDHEPFYKIVHVRVENAQDPEQHVKEGLTCMAASLASVTLDTGSWSAKDTEEHHPMPGVSALRAEYYHGFDA
jgi:hypothetical protein